MKFRTLLDIKNKLPFLSDFPALENGGHLLNDLFKTRATGVFVDIGARHPVMYSNTYPLYKKGWRGINVNPAPAAIRSFELLRPEDINLQLSVSDKEEQLPFFVFNEPAQRSAGYDFLTTKDTRYNSRIKDIITVKANTLANILDWHLPKGRAINLLNLHAEGNAYQILSSNNWNKYRPEIILLQSELSYNGFNNSTLNRFMTQKGYEFFAKKGSGCFLRDSRELAKEI